MSTCLHGKRLPREPLSALAWVVRQPLPALPIGRSLASAAAVHRQDCQQPQPQLLLLPQKQEIRRIQISQLQELLPPNMPLLQPHPQSLLQPQLLLHPQLLPPKKLPPPQQDRSRMIQIQLHPPPHPLLFCAHPQESLHPQFVAVKSLI